jgi:hypothetical protein
MTAITESTIFMKRKSAERQRCQITKMATNSDTKITIIVTEMCSMLSAATIPNDQVNRRAGIDVGQIEDMCRRVRLNAGLGRRIVSRASHTPKQSDAKQQGNDPRDGRDSYDVARNRVPMCEYRFRIRKPQPSDHQAK